MSLVPLLKQTGTLRRKSLYWHFPHYRGKLGPHSIVRHGDWKLIKRYDGGKRELYNLAGDLSETEDLAEDMPEMVRRLDERLAAWLKSTGAKLPQPNPDYQGPAQPKRT